MPEILWLQAISKRAQTHQQVGGLAQVLLFPELMQPCGRRGAGGWRAAKMNFKIHCSRGTEEELKVSGHANALDGEIATERKGDRPPPSTWRTTFAFCISSNAHTLTQPSQVRVNVFIVPVERLKLRRGRGTPHSHTAEMQQRCEETSKPHLLTLGELPIQHSTEGLVHSNGTRAQRGRREGKCSVSGARRRPGAGGV